MSSSKTSAPKPTALLGCLTETKIHILYDHVDRTRFCIVETECQIIQLLHVNIVEFTVLLSQQCCLVTNVAESTMLTNLTPAVGRIECRLATIGNMA